MSKERFNHVYCEMGEFRLQDNVTGEYISITNGYNDEDITVKDKLECLVQENEQLKKQLKQCETLIDNIKRGRVYEDKKRGMMWNE